MAYELSGKVKLVQDPMTFDSGFTKREVVVEVEDGKYTQDICLECLQERVNLLDDVQSGDEVKVSFDIRGREYKGRYFNNLVAWRIEKGGGENAQPAPDEDRPPIPNEPPADVDEDDLPF